MTAIVGRERELAAVDGFLDDVGRRSRLLVIEGDAGMGKTTMWHAAVDRGRSRDFTVLACRGAETEAKIALLGLADLLHDIPTSALQALPLPQRDALEAALARVAPGEGATEQRTLVTALRSLLASLVECGPVLVAVDDAHWVDAATARVVESVARRLPDAPIGWMLTRRIGEPSSLALDSVLPSDAVTRIGVAPLTLAALHHLLQQHVELPITRAVLARIHRVSGGNPLYAIEIARELVAGGGDADVPVPDTLRQLLARRLRRLPTNTREALLRASMLSHPTVDVVDGESLEPAEAAGLVTVAEGGAIEFRHPLYASAVYVAAPKSKRRELHRELADVVTDPEERSRHLAAATISADEAVARELEAGAAVARARGAADSAAELLERARALTPADRPLDRQRRGIAAAEHHVYAGERGRARALLHEVLDDDVPPDVRAAAEQVLGHLALHAESSTEADQRFARSLELTDDPRLVAIGELGRAYCCTHRQDWLAAPTLAERALAAATRSGDPELIADALAFCAMMQFLAGGGVHQDLVHRALELEPEHSSTMLPVGWRPSSIEALLLLYSGRHPEARERLHAVRHGAVARGDESDLAFVLLWLGWLETRAGRLDEARALADETISLALLTESGAMHAWALAQRGYASAFAGDVDAARRDCLASIDLAASYVNALVPLWHVATLTFLELSLQNPSTAWAAAEPAVTVLEATGLPEPVPAFFLPEAIEAMIGVGEVERAEALVRLLEERGQALDRVWALATGARCRGLLLAARGDLDGALAAFDGALVQHERIELPVDRARTLLAKGVVARRARKRALARACFEEALGVFETVGMPMWARRAEAELGRVGLRRSGEGELTGSEQRVAELAARGRSNREVAAALFISPKTVEATLARVYRKLGIASRAELGARIAVGGRDPRP